MTNRLHITVPRLSIIVVGLFLTLASSVFAAGLTPEQRDGYLVWLHSLEETVALRQASGQPEPAYLYPLGILDAAAPVDSSASADLRTVASVLDELESRPRLLQEGAGRTALSALTRARNYRHIAEYDSALSWYGKAAQRDGVGEFVTEIGLETMATAVAAGDSVTVAWHLLDVFGSRDLPAHQDELVLGYRFLVARSDSTNLDLLVREIAAHPDLIQGRIAFWQGFAQSWLQRWPESLATLQGLVSGGGLSHGLDEAQRAWVLMAIPDLMVLTGEQQAAVELYRAVAESRLETAADYASCQAAVLDFLAGRFLVAGTAFERLCNQTAEMPWRGYACDMARLSDEMERLRSEGEDHGAAAVYQR
jgi:hypothetical protein